MLVPSRKTTHLPVKIHDRGGIEKVQGPVCSTLYLFQHPGRRGGYCKSAQGSDVAETKPLLLYCSMISFIRVLITLVSPDFFTEQEDLHDGIKMLDRHSGGYRLLVGGSGWRGTVCFPKPIRSSAEGNRG